MEKNAILAIVLSILILIGWQLLFVAPRQQQLLEEERAKQEELAKQKTPTELGQSQPPGEQMQGTPAPIEGGLLSPEILQRQLNEDAQKIVIETPLLHVILTTQGARILEWKVKAHKDVHRESVDLVSEDSLRLARLPLEIFTGKTSLDEELNQGIYASSVKTITLQSGMEPATVRLYYERLQFTKELIFYPDSYKVDITMTFSDPSQVGKALSIVWGPGIGANLEGINRFEPGIVSKTGEKKLIREAAKKIDGLITWTNTSWAAMNRKYFTAAMFSGDINNTLFVNKIPFQPQKAEEQKEKIEPMRQLLMGLSQPLISGKCQVSLYAGPKERAKLAEAYPGFERLIDYGFFWFIAEPLAVFMTFLYGYVKNYGIVIICLTILIKILFYPLTYKSFHSMKRMQDLQPKMNAIREKYKNDKQQQQQETMKLYKQEGVNPMGGCLPMVLQIPVFFALYQTLSQSIELRGASFLWIPDLSATETLFFKPLVLMMGASMFLQQSMTPTTGDPKQAQMFKFMPILFTAMFWNFPAGLVLYWFMNNILTIGQQYLINKSHKKPSKTKESEDAQTTSSLRKRRKKGK
jgi:YidC/Oxa1 family membrane protein insertase